MIGEHFMGNDPGDPQDVGKCGVCGISHGGPDCKPDDD
jgi:hypothetical protein